VRVMRINEKPPSPKAVEGLCSLFGVPHISIVMSCPGADQDQVILGDVSLGDDDGMVRRSTRDVNLDPKTECLGVERLE
jgi:hypothetical protein